MREIKFRGIYPYHESYEKQDKWIYGYLSKDVKRGGYYIQSIKEGDNGERYLVQKDTIGQFTGLKDKKGKEIYEGDICRYVCGKSEWIAEVVFYHGMFTFPVKEEPLGRYRYIHNILEHELEVIGNIYDNPELLDWGD